MISRIGLAICAAAALSQFPLYADEASSVMTPPAETPPLPVYYESCSPIEIDISVAMDGFRSLPEGSFEGNWGAFTAVNLKAPIPQAWSVQLAGSYGLYDWYGRSSTPKHVGEVQQQGFMTFATSRQTEDSSGLSGGLAYDCMLNRNFGEFAVNPFMSQIRGQLGYLIKGGNELGVWATYGINKSNEKAQQIPLRFRAISQANLFWCHYYKNNGYTMVWAGTPYRRGLMYKSGRPGIFIFGAQFSVPLTSYLALQGTAAYMGARNVSGIKASTAYAADVAIGITYSFGKRRIVQGPYMTPANNSNFIADTNVNF